MSSAERFKNKINGNRQESLAKMHISHATAFAQQALVLNWSLVFSTFFLFFFFSFLSSEGEISTTKVVRTTTEVKKEIKVQHEHYMRILDLALQYGMTKASICTILKIKEAIKGGDVAKGVTVIENIADPAIDGKVLASFCFLAFCEGLSDVGSATIPLTHRRI